MSRTPTIIASLVSLFGALSTTSCKEIECGEGTIERDGTCAPATTTTGAGMCGPFTTLQGDRCVPQFPPTECDLATTMPTVDPDTGVTICIGTGAGGCNAPIACATPTEANRLTVCGQLYDFETGAKLQAAGAMGTACDPDAPAAAGPCALTIKAYDALTFAMNPATASPRASDPLYLDDCGRYRLANINTNATSPFIGLGIDDAGMPNGPDGTTVTVGVVTPKASPVVSDFEAWIVKASTTQMWTQSGGPSLANGIYAATYRKHKLAAGVDRHAAQDGVTFARASDGMTYPSQDHYFTSTATLHQTIDMNATATGANGTALVEGRSLSEGGFGGVGGLGSGCAWEPHLAVSLPGIVFIQIFRKVDVTAGSCTE